MSQQFHMDSFINDVTYKCIVLNVGIAIDGRKNLQKNKGFYNLPNQDLSLVDFFHTFTYVQISGKMKLNKS